MRFVLLLITLVLSSTGFASGIIPYSKDDNSSLFYLKEILKDAKLIGIGESSHASEGFSEERARIIKYLIENDGLRLVLIENPHKSVEEFTEPYINECKGSSELALRSLFPVWRSRSTNELFKWICEYNSKNPNDKVIFKGFDIQEDNPRYFSELKNIFNLYYPENSGTLMNHVSQCISYDLTLEQQIDYIRSVYSSGSVKVDISDEQQNSCLSGIEKINEVIKLDNHLARSDLLKIEIALISLKAFQNKIYYTIKGDRKLSIEARDEGMAKVILKLKELYNKERAIVWAHNAHLAKNTLKIDFGPEWASTKSLGTFLAEKIGASYAPVALIGYKVDFLIYESRPQPATFVINISPPTESLSIEKMLHENSLIDHGAIVDFEKVFNLENVKYKIGVEPEGNMVIPKDQFRAAVFLNSSPPLIRPIPLDYFVSSRDRKIWFTATESDLVKSK